MNSERADCSVSTAETTGPSSFASRYTLQSFRFRLQTIFLLPGDLGTLGCAVQRVRSIFGETNVSLDKAVGWPLRDPWIDESRVKEMC